MEELRERTGSFIFSDMPANIHKVFELLGLHQIMKIVASREQVSEEFSA
jgi:anti-anti-sigma regulatory factor